MILYEDMKSFKHALLHWICVLSPLIKVIFILLNTLKLLMNLSLQKTQI